MAVSNTRLSQLLEQIKFKDKSKIGEVKSAVSKKNLQNSVDESRNTILHYAAKWNNASITQHLIGLGSRVDAQNRDGKTALMLAAENLCSDTIDILINAGASILIEDKLGNSILKMIGNSEPLRARDDIVRILLKDCRLPFDDEAIAKKLVEYKWSLPKVILLRNADITKLMLDRKHFDINDVGFEFHGASALHMAAKYGDAKNAKLLLGYGADITYTDLATQNPLAYLYSETDIREHANEKLDILKMFIERVHVLLDDNIFVHTPSFLRNIALFMKRNYIAKEYSREEAVDLLLRTGIMLSGAVDSRDRTVVHFLAENKNLGVIERLRGMNFNVNSQNIDGGTPLTVAARHGVPNAVKFLISEGADIDHESGLNWPPLFLAIRCCHELRQQQYRDCVQILLECGANAQIATVGQSIDNSYLTVFDMVGKKLALAELVVSHLALQEALGTPLTELINNKIESREQFKTDLESSRRELKVKVYQSATLLDLLTDSEKKFERYVRNQKLYSQLQECSSKTCRLHYFKTILQKRMSKAFHTFEMRKKSAQIICGFMKTDYDRFPLLIGDEITGYLEENDMKNLFDSMIQE